MTYNIITFAMTICLLLGSFAFEGSIKQVCKLFLNHQVISIELSERDENQITGQEEKRVEKAVNEKKLKKLYIYSPPAHPANFHYSYCRYNYSIPELFTLRAPPCYTHAI